MIVHVESEREADFKEDRGQQIEMGEEPFVVVNANTGQDETLIVSEFEQRVLARRAGEPAVRGGVMLPELADVLGLPAAHWLARFFGRSRRCEFFAEGKAADGGAI